MIDVDSDLLQGRESILQPRMQIPGDDVRRGGNGQIGP